MWVRIWRKGNPLTLFREYKLVQPLWKTEWRFLKKIQIELWLHLNFFKLEKNSLSSKYFLSIIILFYFLICSFHLWRNYRYHMWREIKKYAAGTLLVVQWLRLHVPIHRTWVWSLVRKLRSYMMHGSKKKMLQW